MTTGEGTKGGHVIGHTSSGKPIYSGHQHEQGKYKEVKPIFGDEKKKFDETHQGWSAQDHKDAEKVHTDAQDATKNEKAKDRHYAMFSAHRRAREALTSKPAGEPGGDKAPQNAQEKQAQQDAPGLSKQASKATFSARTPTEHAAAADLHKQAAAAHHEGRNIPVADKHMVAAKKHEAKAASGEHGAVNIFEKSMKPQDGPEKNMMDLCKCGTAMKKGADGKCASCGKKMIGPIMAKGIPGADPDEPADSDPSEGASGDPEGKSVNTSDDAGVEASNAMLKKSMGLESWLSKAFGDAPEKKDFADKQDEAEADDDAEKPDAEDGDDLEKSRYVRRTGSPGKYRYEYTHAHPGEHKDKQDLYAVEGHLRGGQYDKKIPGLSDENAKKKAEGLKSALENKHKLMQKWASGEHGDVPDLKTTEMKPNPHLEAADKAEAAGDKDLAVAHHVVGKELHDDRKEASGDWERGEQVNNPQFTAHNDALKRLGHEAHEPDPTQGKWGKTSEHLDDALAKVKASGFKGEKFDKRVKYYEEQNARAQKSMIGRNDMDAFQKNGLSAWMKSNIPGAEDTSGGTDPADDLPKGEPAEDLQPGKAVNGPMLALAGMGKDNTSQGGSNTLASTTGAANPGDTDKLSEDDPEFGQMASGAPGLVSKTPESGNIGQGNGSLSKSNGFIPDAADLRDQQNRARALAARGRGPADLVGVGVGRAAPAQQRPTQAVPTTIRKGQVAYSDASDLAVEALLKSRDGGLGGLDTIASSGPLQKSEACGACGTSKPVWLSTCPECGSAPNAGQMQKSQLPQGRLQLRVTRDLYLPAGTKKD